MLSNWILTDYPIEVKAVPMGNEWLFLVSGIAKEAWDKIPDSMKQAIFEHAQNAAIYKRQMEHFEHLKAQKNA